MQSYAKLMAGWGMPLTAARVYAYLMLQSGPASLDQIAADMGISKASAWGATRHLEQVHQIDRFGEPGSKRALFAPTENFAQTMRNHSRMLSRASALMRDAAAVGAEPGAGTQLLERSDFFQSVHEAIEEAIGTFMAGRAQAAAE